jgi:hypothetical protein
LLDGQTGRPAPLGLIEKCHAQKVRGDRICIVTARKFGGMQVVSNCFPDTPVLWGRVCVSKEGRMFLFGHVLCLCMDHVEWVHTGFRNMLVTEILFLMIFFFVILQFIVLRLFKIVDSFIILDS